MGKKVRDPPGDGMQEVLQHSSHQVDDLSSSNNGCLTLAGADSTLLLQLLSAFVGLASLPHRSIQLLNGLAHVASSQSVSAGVTFASSRL